MSMKNPSDTIGIQHKQLLADNKKKRKDLLKQNIKKLKISEFTSYWYQHIHKCIDIRLHTQWIPGLFGQLFEHLQGFKIKSLDAKSKKLNYLFIFLMTATLTVYHWPMRPMKVKH